MWRSLPSGGPAHMSSPMRVQHVLRLRNSAGWVKEFIYDEQADELEYRVSDQYGFVRHSGIGTLDQFAEAVVRAGESPRGDK